MKIQCPCGTKYSFDATADMVARPITFVCPECGVDSSAVVNQLIRETFGASAIPVATPLPATPAAAPKPAPLRVNVGGAHPPTAATTPASPQSSALRVSVSAAPAQPQSQPTVGSDGPQPCHKHS